MRQQRRVTADLTPSDSRTVESEKASKRKRSGSRGARRKLEQAVRERMNIRNERDPLARRHMPAAERHIAPDEMPARDRSRPFRVEAVTLDVDRAYRIKRGETL